MSLVFRENHNPLHTHDNGYNKKDKASIGENMENLEPTYIASGTVKRCSYIGKQFHSVPKSKCKYTMQSSKSTYGTFVQET